MDGTLLSSPFGCDDDFHRTVHSRGAALHFDSGGHRQNAVASVFDRDPDGRDHLEHVSVVAGQTSAKQLAHRAEVFASGGLRHRSPDSHRWRVVVLVTETGRSRNGSGNETLMPECFLLS